LKSVTKIIISLVSILSACSILPAKEFFVPDQIVISEKPITQEKEWQEYSSINTSKRMAYLESVRFFEGHPSEQNELLLESTPTARKGERAETRSFDFKFTKPIWIECSYSNTNITLMRQLDSSIKECYVYYDSSIKPEFKPPVKRIVFTYKGRK
jgi:hypothetical protein